MSPRLIFSSLAILRLFCGLSWNHWARTTMIQVRLTASATKSTTATMKMREMALFIVASYVLSARRRRSRSLPSRSTLVRCETMSSKATSMRLAVTELPP